MYKTDVYEIVFKIFGIYLVWILIQSVTYSIALLFEEWNTITSLMMLVMLAGILFIYFLLFQTKRITRAICSPEDYKEKLDININSNTLFKLAIVIVGLFLVIDNIPSLISNLLSKWQEHRYGTQPGYYVDSSYMITLFSKVAIGMVFVVSHKRIANLLDKIGLANKSKVLDEEE